MSKPAAGMEAGAGREPDLRCRAVVIFSERFRSSSIRMEMNLMTWSATRKRRSSSAMMAPSASSVRMT
jgi:hypothetical protein